MKGTEAYRSFAETVVQFVVNEITNEVASVDVLYSVNAKTQSAAANKMNRPGAYPQSSQSQPATLTDSKISIFDLLHLVNRYFPDILFENVYTYFGHSNRPAGKLGEHAKFSIPADPSTREESRAEKARRWIELGQKYGTIPEGENAADDYNVPKKVTPNRKVKWFVSNLSQNITPHREAVMLTLCGVVIDFYSNPSLSSLYISSVASLVLATISPPSRGKQ